MSTIKVLIVEDDPMVAEINKNYIHQLELPFSIIGIGSTFQEAIDIITSTMPDLILLDIYLPDGSGMDLLKTIRKQNLPIDVIVITAAKDTVTVQEALRHGAVDFLIKPFRFDRFKQAFSNFMHLQALIHKEENINQADFDSRFRPSNVSQLLSSLPKGVHIYTLKQIMDYLHKQTEAQSCREISENLAMSKITAWRYLEYLVEKERVKVSLEYGTNRPTKRYSLIV